MAGVLLLASSYVNAQNSGDDNKADAIKDKIEQVVKVKGPEAAKTLAIKARKEVPQLAGWSDEAINRIFTFSPDGHEGKAGVRDVPKLNLAGYDHVAEVKHNHKVDGGLEYHINITDRAYQDSNIFKRIKEHNQDIKGAELHFHMKGNSNPIKVIKL